MYQETITLFNLYKSNLGDMWYPTVISGVDLNADRASIVAKYGSESRDNAKLHVRFYGSDNEPLIAGKTYMTPKEWDRLTNDVISNFITFHNGQDFIYLGKWDGNEPIMDGDYMTSKNDGFYDYMNARYDGVYTITGNAKYSLIPHFEIMCK